MLVENQVSAYDWDNMELPWQEAPKTGPTWWMTFVAPDPADLDSAGTDAATDALPDTPPLVTGLPATTPALLREWLQGGESRSAVGAYLNLRCAYFASGGRYWGRALKLNERLMLINTNAVVPGLGVRLKVEIMVELDDVTRVVTIGGIMSRRQDPPAGSAYSASMAIKVQSIDEGSSPGLLIHYLSAQLAA